MMQSKSKSMKQYCFQLRIQRQSSCLIHLVRTLILPVLSVIGRLIPASVAFKYLNQSQWPKWDGGMGIYYLLIY